jgi:Zn-dependent protease with chaperone function
MARKSWLALMSMIVVVVACSAWDTHACLHSGPCTTMLNHPRSWVPTALIALLALSLPVVLFWPLRTLYLVISSSRALVHLPLQDWPAELNEALQRTRAAQVICLETDVPLAFCAGGIRPRIYVTGGLVTLLRPDELDAVLLHEECHRAHRDPLRCAARRAAADVWFMLPVVAWWAEYRRECVELAADRAALRHTGPRPLAGALWAVGTLETPRVGVAFQGAAGLRIAQLLGEPLPRRHPATAQVLASGIGLTVAIAVTWCLSQILTAIT